MSPSLHTSTRVLATPPAINKDQIAERVRARFVTWRRHAHSANYTEHASDACAAVYCCSVCGYTFSGS